MCGDTPPAHSGVCVCVCVLGCQFVFWSTHGDLYYLGLDGFAMYDAVGVRIPLRTNQIAAIPDSVNALSREGGDPRVPGNLATEYDPRYGRGLGWKPACVVSSAVCVCVSAGGETLSLGSPRCPTPSSLAPQTFCTSCSINPW